VTPRTLLLALFQAAVEAARPGARVAAALPPPPIGRTVVIGAGKASADMAAAVEAARGGAVTGVVAIPEGVEAHCRHIECLAAGHPVPDERSVEAAERIRAAISGLGLDDQVIALISGGGSALLCDPVPGLSLADKQAVTAALLDSGATIREINCVRQALSRSKGGRLAQLAAPARVHTLLVSDIPGDDPALIASGPTVASPFAPGEAEAVLARYGIARPGVLAAGTQKPPPNVAELGERCHHVILCSAMESLRAAAGVARAHGITPIILGDALEGEAREMAIVHAGIARSIAAHGEPLAPPAVVLSGGEATVTIDGPAGRGGRNTTFCLALAMALRGHDGIHALACDTDGIDGHGGHAGALVDPTTLARVRDDNRDAAAALADHDSAGLFEAIGDLVDTGPTGTNVNDFRAVLVTDTADISS
jgi:glycerate 2-kinase